MVCNDTQKGRIFVSVKNSHYYHILYTSVMYQSLRQKEDYMKISTIGEKYIIVTKS